MPARNSIKNYIEDGYYHIYNRGVDKRLIFQDPQDYGVYLSYLKEYLSPKDEKTLRDQLVQTNMTPKERDRIWGRLRINNFSDEISLLAYCLMPNHFHLLIKQKPINAIDKFMRALSTRYTMYFNHKYDREGALYQGVYKAVLVTTDEQFLHLSRYIHKQAISMQGATLQEKQPSSFSDYIGSRKTPWLHPEEIIAFFSTTNPLLSYEKFVMDEEDSCSLSQLILEN
jgi:putative transposase